METAQSIKRKMTARALRNTTPLLTWKLLVRCADQSRPRPIHQLEREHRVGALHALAGVRPRSVDIEVVWLQPQRVLCLPRTAIEKVGAQAAVTADVGGAGEDGALEVAQPARRVGRGAAIADVACEGGAGGPEGVREKESVCVFLCEKKLHSLRTQVSLEGSRSRKGPHVAALGSEPSATPELSRTDLTFLQDKASLDSQMPSRIFTHLGSLNCSQSSEEDRAKGEHEKGRRARGGRGE
jgi:hypothetical protein